MIKTKGPLVVSTLLAMAWLAAAQLQNDQVKHLMVNDANLVETQQGYAIMAPMLASNNWKTVSVNGDQIQVMTANCQQTSLNKQGLANMPAQQAALESARQMLQLAESNQPHSPQTQIYRSGSAMYSLRGNSASVSFARNIGMSSFQSNGASVTKYDDQNMSIAKSTGLPNNLNRIFITGDVVTFVYNDGKIQMKPANCLQPDEQQLVQQLKLEVQQAQAQFQASMNQMNQNMQNMNWRMQQKMNQMRHNMQNMNRNMQQNMQQSMQQMHNNLNNMFNRNSFPFNSNFPTNDQFNQQNQNYFQPRQYGNQQPFQPQQQQNFGFQQQQGFGIPPGNFMPFMQPLAGLGGGLPSFTGAGGAMAGMPFGSG